MTASDVLERAPREDGAAICDARQVDSKKRDLQAPERSILSRRARDRHSG